MRAALPGSNAQARREARWRAAARQRVHGCSRLKKIRSAPRPSDAGGVCMRRSGTPWSDSPVGASIPTTASRTRRTIAVLREPSAGVARLSAWKHLTVVRPWRSASHPPAPRATGLGFRTTTRVGLAPGPSTFAQGCPSTKLRAALRQSSGLGSSGWGPLGRGGLPEHVASTAALADARGGFFDPRPALLDFVQSTDARLGSACLCAPGSVFTAYDLAPHSAAGIRGRDRGSVCPAWEPKNASSAGHRRPKN